MRTLFSGIAALGVLIHASNAWAAAWTNPPAAIVKTEFIVDNPPFASSHASTIIESDGQLIAAWFGGSYERSPDVGIWLSSQENGKWSAPQEVATGMHPDEQIRYPCWNPVLFRPKGGPLVLFYKEGPSPEDWWGMFKTSEDNGKIWSKATRLKDGIYGPIRNKPVELSDGTLLCGSSTENAGWRVHMEWAKSPSGYWHRTAPLNGAMEYGAIQPTILVHSRLNIQILCRTKQGVITQSWSHDEGKTWERMTSTGLPNPNSAVDAVLLHDKRALLVYNHARSGRGRLHVALSHEGADWMPALILENELGSEFSYPAVIQAKDGRVHITYTWKRKKIKHVIVDPANLSAGKFVDGEWPR